MNPLDEEQNGRTAAMPSPSGASDLSLDDPRVTEALRAYQAAARAGQRPERRHFLASHPDIAEALAECLDGLEFLQAAAPALRESTSNPLVPADAFQPEGPLGDFRIVREIGRGGMGIVYEAVQISLGRRVALKVLPFAAALDPKQLQRFKTEAQAAAHLHHTHIVPVFGVGCERGIHYYAMQLIAGRTLAALIQDLRAKDECRRANAERSTKDQAQITKDRSQEAGFGPRTSGFDILSSFELRNSSFFRTVAQLGVQAAEALEHAHQQGVVHRDIKPANLLLEERAGGVNPVTLWITDFGLARLQGDAGLTMSGDLLGTVRYMSPEQAQGKGAVVDPRTDIYSLGATLYELLTLRPAYDGRDRQHVLRQIAEEEPRPLRSLDRAIPTELDTIVLKAMSKSPDERYASAQEMADDLRRFLEDKPIRARRPTLRQRVRKWARRHKAVVWAAVVVLVVAVVALAVSTAFIWQAKNGLAQTLERERLNSYFQCIALAEREWSATNLRRAEQLLEQCPANLRGWEWHYLKRLRTRGIAPLRHETVVLCAVASPTVRYLASGSRNGVIKFWDAETGQLVQTFQAHERMIYGLAFSPDGQRLASTGWGGAVKIWEVPTGRNLLSWQGRDALAILSLAFSPDGYWLASGSGDGGRNEPGAAELKIWDAETGQLLLPLAGHCRNIQAVAFSPDGRHLASASADRTIRIWDLTTGQQRLTCRGHTGPVQAVVFSPDGQSLATASGSWGTQIDGEVKLWDARNGQERRTMSGHIGFILSVAFSPDGRRLASAGMDRTVKLWDVASGQEALTLRGHTDVIHAVAFTPDGRRLISAGTDRTLRIWDARPLDEKSTEDALTLSGHRGGVLAVAFSPDGRRLASAGAEGAVKIWDVDTGKERATFRGRSPYARAVAFSPDGRRLAVAQKQEVVVWDTATGEQLLSLTGFPNLVSQVAFNPDGRQLLSAHWDQNVRVWNATTGQRIRTIRAHDWAVFGLALSPDGRRIATAGADDTLRVWDTATGEAVASPQPPHPGHPNSVAFRPDGRVLASASADGTIKFWDAQTWEQLDELRDPTGGVESLAFSPDGQRLAWASTDATVKIRDTTTGKIHTLRGHLSWVKSVAFSPDGQRIASGSLDGTVKIWEVPVAPWHSPNGE